MALAVCVIGSAATGCGKNSDDESLPRLRSAETSDLADDSSSVRTKGTDPSRSGGLDPDVDVASPTTAEPEPDDTPLPPDDVRLLPDNATDLGAELSIAELTIRDPEVPIETKTAWGRRQQFLYRVLAANPKWVQDAMAEIDPSVADAATRNYEARLALSDLVKTYTPGHEVPAWAIHSPKPPEELLGYYREAAEVTGVPWETLAAINLVETRMGRIDGKSVAGAVGPMQFLPSTWEECCEGDPTLDRDAIRGAAEYLVDRGAPDDLDKALKGYNRSSDYLIAITHYTNVLTENADAYYGYHAWDVYYLTAMGPVLLAEGYDRDDTMAVETWLESNPDALIDLTSPG